MIATDLLLIDGDELLYKACAGFEHEAPWDLNEGIWTTWTETDKAHDQVIEKVLAATNHYKPKKTVFCVSGSDDFRFAVDPTYKSDRRKTRKPTGYVHVRDKVLDTILDNKMESERPISFARYDNLEADDCMGILASKPGNEASIILSQDKDMRQIPGMLVRYIGAEPQMVTEYEGNKWFLTQVLTGDVTDGYKGCPGIGPAKAEKMLADIKTRNAAILLAEGWKRVEKAFIDAKLTREDALIQARLARILRWEDWDTTTKQPKLWLPPNV